MVGHTLEQRIFLACKLVDKFDKFKVVALDLTCPYIVDLNSAYRVTKAVKERTSTEMVEVFEGGSFYINTSHSSPTFALGAGMQEMISPNLQKLNRKRAK